MILEGNLPPGKPHALPVDAENIPESLRRLRQFGVWRFEKFTDEETGEIEWDKIPVNACTGRRASSTNPATWCDYNRAVRAYQTGDYDGLAFFLRSGGGLVGIDLDKCRDATTGAIEHWAQRILDKLDTYCELSPSGRGLRLFLYGELPPRDRREGRFECYSAARFLTLTGWPIHPATVEHRQAELTEIHAEIFATRVTKRDAAPAALSSAPPLHNLSDLDIIEKAGAARNGAKFRELYLSGDISGYRSHSEADLALAGMLAFYTGPDPARIDELFRGSGLFRSKWNRPDYRDRTIARALEGRTEFYQPRREIGRRRRHGHSAIAFSLEVS
jgi:primase-polymerase (primpol)-like protein